MSEQYFHQSREKVLDVWKYYRKLNALSVTVIASLSLWKSSVHNPHVMMLCWFIYFFWYFYSVIDAGLYLYVHTEDSVFFILFLSSSDSLNLILNLHLWMNLIHLIVFYLQSLTCLTWWSLPGVCVCHTVRVVLATEQLITTWCRKSVFVKAGTSPPIIHSNWVHAELSLLLYRRSCIGAHEWLHLCKCFLCALIVLRAGVQAHLSDWWARDSLFIPLLKTMLLLIWAVFLFLSSSLSWQRFLWIVLNDCSTLRERFVSLTIVCGRSRWSCGNNWTNKCMSFLIQL